MDETTMYWTLQSTTDDQRPQFKNDHQNPSTTTRPSLLQPSLSPPPIPPPPPSLSPQPPSSSPSPLSSLSLLSIYQTDDQHHQRPEDGEKQQFIPTRLNTAVKSMSVSGAVDPDQVVDQQGQTDKYDDDDSIQRLSTTDERSRHNDGEWPTKNGMRMTDSDDDENDIWGTSARRRTEDDDADDEDDNNKDGNATTNDYYDGAEDDGGYNLLTCRSTNNFYTNIRW